MGCCASTSSKPKQPSNPTHISNFKSPPPTHTLLEEETVKEVLKETETRPVIPKQCINPSPFIRSAPLLTNFQKPQQHKHDAVFKPFTNGELSREVSEIRSSRSASTTKTDKREFNDEVRQRSPAKFKNRSFSGELKREKNVGKSPGRSLEPSPRRARPGDGYGRKNENGESSRRRSRSPVTRVDAGSCKSVLERSQSGRKIGKYPRRVGSELGERVRRVDGGKEGGDSKWPPPASNELIENPLVSLECFIFL